MPPLPKRKLSKARTGRRRSHWRLKVPQMETCSQCGAMVRPHHVCLACGTYRGKQAIEIEKE